MVAQTADAIAVKIVGPDYVDYSMISFGNPLDEKRGVTLTHPASGESFVFRSCAYLRCRGDRIVGRGDLTAFAILEDGAARSATLSLNGQHAPLTAAAGRLRFSR